MRLRYAAPGRVARQRRHGLYRVTSIVQSSHQRAEDEADIERKNHQRGRAPALGGSDRVRRVHQCGGCEHAVGDSEGQHEQEGCGVRVEQGGQRALARRHVAQHKQRGQQRAAQREDDGVASPRQVARREGAAEEVTQVEGDEDYGGEEDLPGGRIGDRGDHPRDGREEADGDGEVEDERKGKWRDAPDELSRSAAFVEAHHVAGARGLPLLHQVGRVRLCRPRRCLRAGAAALGHVALRDAHKLTLLGQHEKDEARAKHGRRDTEGCHGGDDGVAEVGVGRVAHLVARAGEVGDRDCQPRNGHAARHSLRVLRRKGRRVGEEGARQPGLRGGRDGGADDGDDEGGGRVLIHVRVQVVRRLQQGQHGVDAEYEEDAEHHGQGDEDPGSQRVEVRHQLQD
eukprot:scaffold12898_cov100-Isochrysis_galbana.AAC.1